MARKIYLALFILLLLAGNVIFARAMPDAYGLDRVVISSVRHRVLHNENYHVEAVVGQPAVGENPSNADYTVVGGYHLPPGGTPDQDRRIYLPLIRR